MPGHWDDVERIVQSALALTPHERAPFVANACGSDAVLRADVESLLALSARADAESNREDARAELRVLSQMSADREAALDEAEKRRSGADAYLVALRRREAQLREKGVSEKEMARRHTQLE